MSPANHSVKSQELSEIAQNDLDFVFRLLHLGENSTSDVRIWGAFIQKKYDLQIVRRLYVRMFVSLVESVLSMLKDEALRSSEHLSMGEKAILAETKYELSDQGEVIKRPFFVPLQKSLRFAFRSFAKANKISFKPDYGGEGWRAFSETVKIRNRITHPKQMEEMTIKDAEIELVDKAHDWFIESYRGLLNANIVKIKRQLSE